MVIIKTTEYDLFIFREDNREKIDQTHVRRLADSIKSRNLLELRPINVNSKMEIIDGQHRLLAAKMIGVEIYYTKQDNLDASSIMLMNITKPWGSADYLNFFIQQGYEQYIKLKQFMTKNNLSLKIALNICTGQSHDNRKKFKMGEFKFDCDSMEKDLEICWETIFFIKKLNGFSSYTHSTRFWKALIIVTRHELFDVIKWRNNVQRMVGHFCPKATASEYLHSMLHIHNWHNNNKITLQDLDT